MANDLVQRRFCGKLFSLIFIDLIEFFLYSLSPFGSIGALHFTGIGLIFLNVKLGGAYKLILINDIC